MKRMVKLDFSKVETDVTGQLEKLVDEIEAEIKQGKEPLKVAVVIPEKKKDFNPNDLINLKELSSELKVDGRLIRKWLRKHMAKAEGRWEWKKDDPALKAIRAAFKSK